VHDGLVGRHHQRAVLVLIRVVRDLFQALLESLAHFERDRVSEALRVVA